MCPPEECAAAEACESAVVHVVVVRLHQAHSADGRRLLLALTAGGGSSSPGGGGGAGEGGL